MAENTTFEVHVQRGGQWTIHETYKGHQREPALEDAKEQLSRVSNIDAVKVIKETLDPESGVFNDSVIFKAEASKKPISKKGLPRQGRGADKGGDGVSARKGKLKSKKAPAEKEEISLKAAIVRVLVVIIASMCIAALFAVLASELVGGTRMFGIRFVGRAETNLLVSVFILVFLISATGLAIAVMRNVKLKKAKHSKLMLWILGMRANAQRRAAEKMAAKQQAQAKKAVRTGVAAGPSAETMAEAEQQAEEPVEKQEEEPPPPEPEPEEAPQTDPDTLSPTAEKLKTYMLGFLDRALEDAQVDPSKLDNFNKFGVSMFMAGAREILSQKGNMDLLSRSKILADGVQVMGFKKSHAASFADRYEEYLMADSRYMQMFQAGRNAINIFLTDEAAGSKQLESALTEWSKPKPKEEQAGPVTVLFTDIAGSTAMTQALGDAGAQQVVRVHNRIVREALSAHAGKEIKHTGDGIMASFAKTSDGVEGAIQMQRECMVHNEATLDLPLHLKIGLNAGEPIAEDNDLFSTVVQLSARIVDKASADQIYVSEIIRGICAGKEYKFSHCGDYPMKGFDEDVSLYEVMWNDAAPDGASPEAAAPAEAPQPAEAPAQAAESPTQ
ncbi:MAG TPA: adenylate/guanylate cyclase domain-containing protein [Rhodospirillales bacterium]|nr:adenylate/guanylate cyclase domain-containing protein [Rhodospirillales bacterium]